MQVRCKTWEAKRQLACVRACMHDGERLEQRLVRTQYHSTKPCVLCLGLHDTGTTIIMWVSKQDGVASRLARRWKAGPAAYSSGISGDDRATCLGGCVVRGYLLVSFLRLPGPPLCALLHSPARFPMAKRMA